MFLFAIVHEPCYSLHSLLSTRSNTGICDLPVSITMEPHSLSDSHNYLMVLKFRRCGQETLKVFMLNLFVA